MSNILYQKALEYVVRGYSVIPLKKNKTPILSKNITYQRERPPTESELEQWWTTNPEANIGICTGKISGLTVVDIDTSGGAPMPLSTFPETYTVQTPTGGYHLYYEYDPEISQTSNTYPQFPHVDIRNDGGYVVAPPSHCIYEKGDKSFAGSYHVIKAMGVAPFPRSLFIKKSTSSKTKVNALMRAFPKMAEGDGRNNALTAVLGKILNVVPVQDYESVAYPMTLSANSQFQKPLSPQEVRTIFDSIKGKQLKKPLSTVEFLRNDKGIICNEENVYRTIKSDPLLASQFRYNIFTGFIETKFQKVEWETLQKTDITSVRMYLMRTYEHFSKVNHPCVEDTLITYSYEHKVSPPVEYLKTLVWDNQPRLDTWLCNTYNVDDNVYHRAVGSNWIKGLVKRLVHPGSKFDYVLVLEGKQGTKKSTSLATLGKAWHVETVLTPENKDFFMIFGGKAIVEFSEGQTLSRAESKHLKAIITMQFDKYRPPYEKAPKEFPRQCIFAMSTNDDTYLKDETGNRRWLPVACKGNSNIDWIVANRDQLFAEAYHRVITQNETTYEFPEEETRLEQASRQVVDPREEQIYEWYFTKLGVKEREEGITTRMAFIGGVCEGKIGLKEIGRLEEMVVSSILKSGLLLSKRRVMQSGNRFYRYYPSKESEAMAPENISLISQDQIFNTWGTI